MNACVRCGHEWRSRVATESPTRCPRCKSPDYDRPKGTKIKHDAGRRRKDGTRR